MMSTAKHIEYFKVENFKRFSQLELKNIGLFNLFVGDNNIGKTSVLESLMVNEYLPNYLYTIEMLFGWRNLKIQTKDFNYFNLIFNNVNDNEIRYFVIFKSQTQPLALVYQINSVSDLNEQDVILIKTKLLNGSSSKYIIKEIKDDETTDINYLSGFVNQVTDSYVPFIPFYVSHVDDLIDFYSSNFQLKRSKKNDLIKSLKTFIPDIENIEITTGLIPDQSTLSIWKKNYETPFLINAFGEGTVKTLRILLEISQCSNSYLTIDEIDTGIHYSRLIRFWETILLACLENNVQLFATTHSKECLESYTTALKNIKTENNGRIIRLVEDQDKNVNAFTYNYEQFEQSLNYENEIR